MLFCFRSNPHPTSLDRSITGQSYVISAHNLLTDYGSARGTLAVTLIILPSTSSWDHRCHRRAWTSPRRICHALYRAPELSSVLPVPPHFSVPRSPTPPPVCRGAAHPLPRRQPLIGRARIRTIFSIPTFSPFPLLLALLHYLLHAFSLSTLCEFTDQHGLLGCDEPAASRYLVRTARTALYHVHVLSHSSSWNL